MTQEPYFVADNARHTAEIVATFALNHNVRYFRLRFAGLVAGQRVGLPPGRHLRFYAKIFDPTVEGTVDESRSYTPISDPDAHGGEAEFAIKIYTLKNEKSHGVGLFSRHLASLKIGDRLDVSGPRGKYFYVGDGRFQRVFGEIDAYRRVGLVAGGAGITPIIRIIRAFVSELDTGDAAIEQFSLLYTNHREEDILFRDELESYASEYPNNFRLLFTLTDVRFSDTANTASADAVDRWRSIVPVRTYQMHQPNFDMQQPQLSAQQPRQSVAIRTIGRINEEMLRQILPPLTSDKCKLSSDINDNSLIFIRGRKEMKKMAEKLCEKIGYKNVR